MNPFVLTQFCKFNFSYTIIYGKLCNVFISEKKYFFCILYLLIEHNSFSQVTRGFVSVVVFVCSFPVNVALKFLHLFLGEHECLKEK